MQKATEHRSFSFWICPQLSVILHESTIRTLEKERSRVRALRSCSAHVRRFEMTVLVGAETRMIEIYLPKVFPTMSQPDRLTVEQWYVRENDMVQPGDLLLEVEAPVGLIDIPAPPEVTVPHRVRSIVKQVGSSVRLGDLLIVLEPAVTSSK